MITDHKNKRAESRAQHLPASSGVRITASAMAWVADGDVEELRALNRNDMLGGRRRKTRSFLFFRCRLLDGAQ